MFVRMCSFDALTSGTGASTQHLQASQSTFLTDHNKRSVALVLKASSHQAILTLVFLFATNEAVTCEADETLLARFGKSLIMTSVHLFRQSLLSAFKNI